MLFLILIQTKKQFISVFCEDITKQKEAELRLRKNLSELKRKNKLESTIRKVTQDVHKSINLEDVFSNAVNTLNKNINNIDQVGLYIVEDKKAVLKASKNYPKSFFEKISIIDKPKGFTWKTLIDGKPRYVKNAQNDKYIGQAGKELGTKSYASVPIKFKNKTIGVININSQRLDAFDSNELNLLEITAKQIEVAINNARQAEALQKSENALKENVAQLSKKNRYESIVNIVSQSVHKSIELNQVLDNAVNAMSKNIDSCNHPTIYLVEGDYAILKSYRGYPKWFLKYSI